MQNTENNTIQWKRGKSYSSIRISMHTHQNNFTLGYRCKLFKFKKAFLSRIWAIFCCNLHCVYKVPWVWMCRIQIKTNGVYFHWLSHRVMELLNKRSTGYRLLRLCLLLFFLFLLCLQPFLFLLQFFLGLFCTLPLPLLPHCKIQFHACMHSPCASKAEPRWVGVREWGTRSRSPSRPSLCLRASDGVTLQKHTH